MNPLTIARVQMEVSLGFHMMFAALGIGMPLLMVIAEGRYLRGHGDHWKALAKTWGKATAILFVVGAVSGTALSFELGLLWPRFMQFAGPVIGPAFTLEGYAFLLEAIFVGLYLYGWDRMSPRAHFWAGVPVAITGCLSGILVVGANAWMQSPRGYTASAVDPFRVVDTDPIAVFRNPSWAPLAMHSTFACYAAVGFAVAGIYAWSMLRGRDTPKARAGLSLALWMGGIASVLQPLSGDRLAKLLYKTQPAKLAAMEAHFHTDRGVPLLVGGFPNAETGEVSMALPLPKMLSFMSTGDFNGEIQGLFSFPPADRPNVLVCHIAFQIMVGAGTALLGVALLWLVARVRFRHWLHTKWLLRAALLASPLGFLALEAGWVVTEAGRQPWIVYGVMRTRDAVTSRADLGWSLALFSLLYVGLGVVLIGLLRRIGDGTVGDHHP